MRLADNPPLFAGIDAGGSHCRVRLENAVGDELATAKSGPSNLGLGPQRVQQEIMLALQTAIQLAGLQPDDINRLHVAAGMAGAHLPELRQQALNWSLPFASWQLTTDLHTACLGAHAGQDGAVIILGTGFSAIALRQGQEHLIGGYGFPVNATCSGAGLGLEAVKAVLLALDEVGPATQLSERLHDDLGCSGYLLAEKLLSATPELYARLAPLVFAAADEQDEVACAILRQGAAFIELVVTRLLQDGSLPLCLLGGVAGSITPWLSAQTRQALVSPAASAQQGAIWLARREYPQHRMERMG
ncbi:BadF/BadG/BcrA/BcrD ATPase family protein [Alkalimonas collagenimarina]|uniref:BadF/BadG/BcrA/BcrD ATPase family protein n=1 Tax=Alkalimonas collagenimarina TaxID=400390 RepID=A0ABT9H0P7_9GAMM|nr:BadF/BadG/BcrA/BcrD ATPase family protein [Alkalimonas collagenimarina]MDP4536664.1 BadF/BadG/BcrA/BcrD ATPase family protein [Alkalimonas collagenimarina]